MVDEANIETHGMKPMGRLSSDPYWQSAYVDRVARMVQTNKNHTSIIIWSLGNESGDGVNFVAARKALLALDSTRPVQYEGGGEGPKGRTRGSERQHSILTVVNSSVIRCQVPTSVGRAGPA